LQEENKNLNELSSSENSFSSDNDRDRCHSVTYNHRKPFDKTEDEETIERIFFKLERKQRKTRSCCASFYSKEAIEKDNRVNTSCTLDYTLQNSGLKRLKNARCNSTLARLTTKDDTNDRSISSAKVSIDDFEVIKGLSSGAYGKVCLVKKRTSGDYFAMKIIDKEVTADKSQEDYIKSEVTIMRNMDSDYVVKLYYSFQNDLYLFFVMEYMNGGDLDNLLQIFGCLEEKVILHLNIVYVSLCF
jgi:hypothetical protein